MINFATKSAILIFASIKLLSKKTMFSQVAWLSFIIPYNYKRRKKKKKQCLLQWSHILKKGIQAQTYPMTFLVYFYKCLTGTFFYFLSICNICYVYLSEWKIKLFFVNKIYHVQFLQWHVLLKIWLLLPKLKEYYYSKDET